MGIVVPETCWEIVKNKHLTVASCWFSLSLHNLLTMHGHRNLKFKNWWNILRIKRAPSWFHLQDYVKMHGQQILKIYLFILYWYSCSSFSVNIVVQILFSRLFFPCYIYPHKSTNCEVLRYQFPCKLCIYIYIYILHSCVQPNGLLGQNMKFKIMEYIVLFWLGLSNSDCSKAQWGWIILKL